LAIGTEGHRHHGTRDAVGLDALPAGRVPDDDLAIAASGDQPLPSWAEQGARRPFPAGGRIQARWVTPDQVPDLEVAVETARNRAAAGPRQGSRDDAHRVTDQDGTGL